MFSPALLGTALAVVVAGCAGPRGLDGSGSGEISPERGALKRIVAAVQSDPPVLTRRLTIANEPGLDVIENLINPGLAVTDDAGVLRAVGADQIPTVANGLWEVFPDGRMQTTWKLRSGVRWHDGAAFTAEDVLFTHRVGLDPEVALSRNLAYQAVDAVEASDLMTVVIRWSRPFIEADTAFARDQMPRHLLERAYLEDKGNFTQLPYWSQPLVGMGPYRVREWVRGSHLILDAYDQYVLGRPKVDVVEVKFIADQNTLIAHILAGSVELTLGKTITFEQALDIRERWTAGRIETAPANAVQVFPQLLSPNPAVIGDPRFRRALFHATDRQEIVDTLMPGLSSVVHSYLGPTEPPEYQALVNRVVRYDHDPRRAIQLIEALGYIRGAEGGFRDSAGQRLSVEIRTITTDINQKAMLSVADYWQRAGVAVEPVVIPRQLAQDPEYRATFPGFELVRNSANADGLKRHPISQTPLPENNYRGNNRTRYMNPEFDGLLERYFRTIPIAERARVFGNIIHHMTDNVLVMGLFYDVEPTAIGERLRNVGPRRTGSTQSWNAHLWDVTS